MSEDEAKTNDHKKHTLVICKEGLDPSAGLKKESLAAGMAAASAFLGVAKASGFDPTKFTIRIARTDNKKHACFSFGDVKPGEESIPFRIGT